MINLQSFRLCFKSSYSDDPTLNADFKNLLKEENENKKIRRFDIKNYITQNFGDNKP